MPITTESFANLIISMIYPLLKIIQYAIFWIKMVISVDGDKIEQEMIPHHTDGLLCQQPSINFL